MTRRPVQPAPIPAKLTAVVKAIGERNGAVPPTAASVQHAAELLAISPQTAIIQQCSLAQIYWVEENGERAMVAVYTDDDGNVYNAHCPCGSPEVCHHILAVLACIGKPLT
jgi:hypothetical protein